MERAIKADAATLACLLIADPACHRLPVLRQRTGWERDRFNLAVVQLLEAVPDMVALGEVGTDDAASSIIRHPADGQRLRAFVKQVEAELTAR